MKNSICAKRDEYTVRRRLCVHLSRLHNQLRARESNFETALAVSVFTFSTILILSHHHFAVQPSCARSSSSSIERESSISNTRRAYFHQRECEYFHRKKVKKRKYIYLMAIILKIELLTTIYRNQQRESTHTHTHAHT